MDKCLCSFCYDLRCLALRCAEAEREPKNDARRMDAAILAEKVRAAVINGEKCIKAQKA